MILARWLGRMATASPIWNAAARESSPPYMPTREFLGFQFDTDTGRLQHGDRLIPLEFQPSKVLERLVASAGDVVTRDELIATLWGDDTHVKYDDGLNYCIRQVRAALGDDPRAPRFIETIPRRGYRFIAPVTDAVPPKSGRPVRRVAIPLAAAAVLLTIAVESQPNNHHEVVVAVARAVHDLIF